MFSIAVNGNTGRKARHLGHDPARPSRRLELSFAGFFQRWNPGSRIFPFD